MMHAATFEVTGLYGLTSASGSYIKRLSHGIDRE